MGVDDVTVQKIRAHQGLPLMRVHQLREVGVDFQHLRTNAPGSVVQRIEHHVHGQPLCHADRHHHVHTGHITQSLHIRRVVVPHDVTKVFHTILPAQLLRTVPAPLVFGQGMSLSGNHLTCSSILPIMHVLQMHSSPYTPLLHKIR